MTIRQVAAIALILAAPGAEAHQRVYWRLSSFRPSYSLISAWVFGMLKLRLPQVCLLLAIGLVSAVPLAGAVASAPASGQAAILLNPRLSKNEQLEIIAGTEARIVRFGALNGVVIVDMPDTRTSSALRQAGAWLIADPLILGGCLNTRSEGEGALS